MSQVHISSPPVVPGATPSGRVHRLSHRTRRRAIALGILTAVLVAVLLLAADAVLSARRMLSGISAARNDLIDGGNSVVTGDPVASVVSFRAADRAAGSAVAAAGHPGIRLLSKLPWIGDNIRAVTAVAEASQATAQAGLSMADAASALGWHDLRLPGTSSLGDVDLIAITAATPKIDAVATQLEDALAELSAAGSAHLLGPVAAGYDDAITVLARRAALADDARGLFHVLPRLLGGNAPRRYLLAVGSLAQPQGPGGRVGPVGVLTASDGALSLEPLAPADPAVSDALTSPDVPVDARAMLAAASEQGISGLDGVILVDTAGLQDLLWMVGDVDVAGLPDPLSQNNTVTTLDRDVFLGKDAAAADAQQAMLAGELIDAALTRRPSTEAFGTAMAEMVNGRHFAVYSTDRKTQAWLRRLGAAGELDTSGNVLALTMDTTGTNRTGTFLHSPVSVGVTLDDAGTATFRLVMDVTNDAPNTPPSVLLGRAFSQHPIGSFAGDAHFYLPASADHITIEPSPPSQTLIENDLGVPVATAALSMNAGDSASVTLRAQVSTAAVRVGTHWEYVIRIIPQPSAAPQPLRVLVRVPTGRSVINASDGVEIAGSLARYVGEPNGALTLFVRYR